MISEKTTITINTRNINKYPLNNIGDYIEIKTEELPKYSRVKVSVICDGCGLEKEIPYCNYTKYDKPFGLYYCKDCISEALKQSNLRNHDVENVFQLEKTKDKIQETCLEKYNFKHHLQNKDILQIQINTNIEKTGYAYQMQNPINKEKSIETCNIKYGCDSNMGDEEIFNKQRKSALKLKQYKDIFYQGTYELDFLEKYYHLGIVRGFPIKYGNKTYHPDFYLKDFDLVIEIKSTYWFNKHKELCLEKEKYTKLNHNYIIILDKNYEEFETIIKNPN